MWIFFIFGVGKEWIEKKKLQKRGKVGESWEKEEGKGEIVGKRGDGRGLMKRETGSKGRKCANEKMAGNEDIGGKRR